MSIPQIPYKEVEDSEKTIEKLTKENYEISKTEWDSYENSWDFEKHPLI